MERANAVAALNGACLSLGRFRYLHGYPGIRGIVASQDHERAEIVRNQLPAALDPFFAA